MILYRYLYSVMRIKLMRYDLDDLCTRSATLTYLRISNDYFISIKYKHNILLYTNNYIFHLENDA